MSALPVILAAPALPYESELVRLAPTCVIQVIRRPLDAAELLGIASIEGETPVIIGVDLPRLDASVIELLVRGGRVVIGLAEADRDREQCLRMGIPVAIQGTDPSVIWQKVSEQIGVDSTHIKASEFIAHASSGVWPTGAWMHEPQTLQLSPPPVTHTQSGKVLAVWGPQGAPGRTLTALVIAQLLAARGNRVLVIDADTVAPAMTLLSGIVEDASGIVVACRYAQRGTLTPQAFMQLARPMSSNCWLVGGISHPDRWEELDARSLKDVLSIARAAVDFIVVDVGFGLSIQSTSAGLLDVPRYAGSSVVLEQANFVLAIAQSSPLGIARFLQQLPTVQSHANGTLTLGLRETDGHSVSSMVKSLRTYGVHHQIVQLPTMTDASLGSGVSSGGGFLRRKSDQWRQLHRWCASLSHGEGSTTINVPTLANL